VHGAVNNGLQSSCYEHQQMDIFAKPMRSYGLIATRPVYNRMRSLQVGEAFTVAPQDWPIATPPTDTIGKNARYRAHFKVEELDRGRGWRIIRVK
jgi:hypothetical protein